jgi:expansin (peptidoglycan-binding protein)
MKKKICFVLFMLAFILAVPCTAQAKAALNKKNVTLTVGKSVTLKMKGTKKKVKWSTSNKKVATVSAKGKVKAKKAGKATITAKLGKKKYKCKVVVLKKGKTMKETTTEQNEKTTSDKSEEKTTEKTTEKATEVTTEMTTEKATEKITEQITEVTTETTTEKSTETTTENTTGTKDTETVAPSEDTLNADAGEYSLTYVHSGEGTYYYRESTGAANLDYLEDTYYTAAMNNEDYMNGLAGAYIEITDKDGDKVNVVITDRLPEGAKGDIDLSPSAFEKIEPLVTGRMNITWKIIPFPAEGPIQYVFKPTSSQYWAEVQVRNAKYPIKKLEYYDKSTNSYVELPRQEYNYFTAKTGMGEGPYTFRVTDFYGHVLVDTGIAINATETPVNGAANFPD